MKVIRRSCEQFDEMPIPLGRQGESGVTRIEVDVSRLANEYPNASFSVRAVRPDGTSYQADSRLETNTVIWEITSRDTESQGQGKAQVVMNGENGEIKKTGVAVTQIAESVDIEIE